MKNFAISTAVDYPSDRPHLGHLYEKVCADVLARWSRLKGKVHFSTGLDSHGLKIQRAAEKAGKEPREFVKEMEKYFLQLCKEYNISYDDFIKTTEKRHEKTVIGMIKKLNKQDYIYKGVYSGYYCADCETYFTEKELVNEKNCPVHNKSTEFLKEESYFFKMSKFQDRLINYIKNNPNFIRPESKRNEILNRLKEPLRDLSLTRKNVKWGIPFPLDKDFILAIWVDALINYLTTLNYPNKKYKDFWPTLHIIGSDIIWHHSVIWGSWLLASKIKLPDIFVHGFIRSSTGEKMSKSKGNVVDPLELVKRYPSDTIRYFLIREIPFGEDGDFSEKALKARINGELVNELGNLVNRSLSLKFKGKIIGKQELKVDVKKIDKFVCNYELHKAVDEIFGFVRDVNRYINDKEPWKLEGKELGNVLYNLVESLRIISILISAFMPETSLKINKQLGVKSGGLKDCKFSKFKGKIKKGEYLFKKV